MEDYTNKDYTDVEEKIKQAADDIPLPDAQILLAKVDEARAKKKKRDHMLKILIPSCVCAALCVILTLTFIFVPEENKRKYYNLNELLIYSPDSLEKIYDELKKAKKSTPDFSRYYTTEYCLVVTRCKKVKGAIFGGQDKEDPDRDDLECLFKVYSYDTNVKVVESQEYNDLSEVHFANGTKVSYRKIVETEAGVTTYTYYANTIYKNMQYFIEYMSFYDDATVFFDNIFVK